MHAYKIYVHAVARIERTLIQLLIGLQVMHYAGEWLEYRRGEELGRNPPPPPNSPRHFCGEGKTFLDGLDQQLLAVLYSSRQQP